MSKDQEYIRELAQTVNQLFAEGRTDPSAVEIAHRHFGDRSLGGEIVEGVRRRLGRIRKLLEEDYDLQLCPLGRTYYTRFRRRSPSTRAEARRCLPIGRSMKQEGLHLLTGQEDRIWQEWVSLNGLSAAGKFRRFTDDTLKALEAGHLGMDEARELLAATYRFAESDKPEIAARVMHALPDTEAS